MRDMVARRYSSSTKRKAASTNVHFRDIPTRGSDAPEAVISGIAQNPRKLTLASVETHTDIAFDL
jgi:hypothetical protein